MSGILTLSRVGGGISSVNHCYLSANIHNMLIILQKQNRAIDCDTWIATRTDYPFSFPQNSTWEWYFATVSIIIITNCMIMSHFSCLY